MVADLSLVLFFPISFHFLFSFFFLYFKYLSSFIFKFHKTITRKQILSFVPGKADELIGSTERSFSDTHTDGNVRSQ